MELVPHKTLADNGIIRSSNTTKLYCIPCASDTSYATYAAHIQRPSHVQQLRQFRLIFETSDDNARCTICNCFVIWSDMTVHAESHNLVPWFESDNCYDKYKIFFDNKIFQWNNSFRCCLCHKNFLCWESTLIHITDVKHQNLRKKWPQVQNLISAIQTTCEILVRDCLIALNDNELQCQICGGQNVTASSFKRHVKGLMHLSLKSKFHLTSNDWETGNPAAVVDTKILEPQKSDYEQVVDVGSEKIIQIEKIHDKTVSSLNYVLKRKDNLHYCMVCNCEVSECAIDNHIMNEAHMVALNRWGCDRIILKKGVDYDCGYCNCTICSLENVYAHIKGKKHLNSLRLENEKHFDTAKKSDIFVEPESEVRSLGQKVPCMYFARLNKINMHCMVCDCLVSSTDINMKAHAEGKYHKNSLKKYGCEKISMIGRNIYHCECCNIRMPDVETVYNHIKESSHMNSVIVASERQAQIPTKKDNKVQVQREASNPNELFCSIMTENYVTLRTTGSYCEICQIKLGNDRFQILKHIAESKHAGSLQNYRCNGPELLGDRYYCSSCKCYVYGSENFDRHVKGRRHLQRSNDIAANEPLTTINPGSGPMRSA